LNKAILDPVSVFQAHGCQGAGKGLEKTLVVIAVFHQLHSFLYNASGDGHGYSFYILVLPAATFLVNAVRVVEPMKCFLPGDSTWAVGCPPYKGRPLTGQTGESLDS
jgi:hypothetical protein